MQRMDNRLLNDDTRLAFATIQLLHRYRKIEEEAECGPSVTRLVMPYFEADMNGVLGALIRILASSQDATR